MDTSNHEDAIAKLELLYAGRCHQEIRSICENQRIPEEVRAYAAGLLSRPWLPWGGFRRIMFFSIIAIALIGPVFSGSWWFLLALLVAAAMSPRLIAEVLVSLH